MWRRFSLRLRINLLFAILLTLALAAGIGALVAGAGARVKAEVAASTRLSAQFVEAALASLRDSPDPRPGLSNLIRSLQNLRHVRIYLSGTLSDSGHPRPQPAPGEAADNAFDNAYDNAFLGQTPRWFAALTPPRLPATRIAADIGGRNYGQIVIASRPSNEIAEVWRDVRNLALGGVMLTFMAFGLTYAVAGHALAPIGLIGDGLTRLKKGDYAFSIPPGGAPELREICARLNDLARTLGAAMAENRLLVQKLISVQDDERKELARELHDEMGPYLFAIRAGALSLAAQAEQGAVEDAGAGGFVAACRTLVGHVNEVQRMNASTLRRLRPQALDDLGASEALEALVGAWSSVGPALEVRLSLPPGLDEVGETVALTLYRIVQEGLTNVRRHSGATQAEVAVAFAGGCGEERPMVRVSVTDNGAGLPEAPKHGLGLLGMSERVRALGGTMELTAAEGGGAALRVTLPVE